VLDGVAGWWRPVADWPSTLFVKMTVLKMIIAVLHCLSNRWHVGLMYVCVTAVAVNSVCAGEQCMHEMCVSAQHDIVRSLGTAISQDRRIRDRYRDRSTEVTEDRSGCNSSRPVLSFQRRMCQLDGYDTIIIGRLKLGRHLTN